MTDDQHSQPFVPPSPQGYPSPGGSQLPGYHGGHEAPRRPQPDQGNLQRQMLFGKNPGQPVRRRTGMFVGGIILTSLGGLFLLIQISLPATATDSTAPSDPAKTSAALIIIGLLTAGIIMLVRSGRR